MLKRVFAVSSLVFVLIFALAACAPVLAPVAEPVEEATATSAPAEPVATEAPVEVDPLAVYMPDAVAGAIVSAGSSTVFPLSERMKQRFEEEGFTGEITIDSIGSGAGFERFCQRLLRESGFEDVRITGRSGDGGIDGIGIQPAGQLLYTDDGSFNFSCCGHRCRLQLLLG